jgi:tRNA/rRNA methyltransferase
VRPRLVFLHPRSGDNLAVIAETMARFGFVDWVVVCEPRYHAKIVEVLRAHRPAGPFTAAVEQVRRVDSLRAAVEGCRWVVGTTMRELDGRPRLTSRELAERVTDEPWALVFGAEMNGMTDDDLAQCHASSFLPTSDAQPSVNLAQAVLLYLYELASAPEPSLLATLRVRFGADAEALVAPLSRARLTAHEAALWRAVWLGERLR